MYISIMYSLHKYRNGVKKFYVITPEEKIISFGSKGYQDFTTHKDPKRKASYLKRHQVRENWKDLDKPGTWSRYLLWNKPNLDDSIIDMEKRFGIEIVY